MKSFSTLSCLLLLILLLSAERCAPEYKMPDSLMGSWVHSHEEDFGGNMVYRRPTYDFPPSRGRERFDMRPDGKLLYYGIAPNDGMAQPEEGKWTSITERTIDVDVPKQAGAGFSAELIEITPERLVLRKVEEL